MTANLYVIGAGGFGREVVDVVEAINGRSGNTWKIQGVFDDNPSEINLGRLAKRRLPYLGPLPTIALDGAYVIGVGSPSVRTKLAMRMNQLGSVAATLIHPSSNIGGVCEIGEGTVICGGAQVSTNVTTGIHVHVNPNATIGHDVVLEDFVSVNPGAIVSGDVRVGSRSLIGAGAVVLQGRSVGTEATVGAAACVTKSVPRMTVVAGIPARPLEGA